MTPTAAEITLAALTSQSYDALSTISGVVVIALLVILLVLKEMMRAWGGSRAERWGKVLNVAIVPLLLLFGLIIVMRLAALL